MTLKETIIHIMSDGIPAGIIDLADRIEMDYPNAYEPCEKPTEHNGLHIYSYLMAEVGVCLQELLDDRLIRPAAKDEREAFWEQYVYVGVLGALGDISE